MPNLTISRDRVIERSHLLPSFPRFVTDILAALDDPDGSLTVLADCVIRDPIITARVLSAANIASARTRHMAEVNNIYNAISLIGMSQVRQLTLISGLGAFVGGVAVQGMPTTFWRHCVAVGVCCEELALNIEAPISTDAALVAGLLHDIGQLWLFGFNADAYRQCWRQALSEAHGIEEVEREHFGVDHATVGAWLAQHWALPAPIVAAIQGHHQPGARLDEPLVPLVHVAEVLANALDLGGGDENRVVALSSLSCQQLGLVWDDRIRPMFGRIESRSRHTNTFFPADATP